MRLELKAAPAHRRWRCDSNLRLRQRTGDEAGTGPELRLAPLPPDHGSDWAPPRSTTSWSTTDFTSTCPCDAAARTQHCLPCHARLRRHATSVAPSPRLNLTLAVTLALALTLTPRAVPAQVHVSGARPPPAFPPTGQEVRPPLRPIWSQEAGRSHHFGGRLSTYMNPMNPRCAASGPSRRPTMTSSPSTPTSTSDS